MTSSKYKQEEHDGSQAEMIPEVSQLVKEKIGSATGESSPQITKEETSRAKPRVPSTQEQESLVRAAADVACVKGPGKSSAKDPGKSSANDEDHLTLHIWDFAGHELYYTTHQVDDDLRTPSPCIRLASRHSGHLVVIFYFHQWP